jgi:hypothetical protein
MKWPQIILFTLALTARAEQQTSSLTNQPIRQIDSNTVEIGVVRLDKTQKSVTFPAFLNMDKGMIEYVIVTSTGKTHESLLRTDAQPMHIHLAMLLLGAKGISTNTFPEDAKAAIPGDNVTIQMSWKDAAGVEKRFPPEDFIINQEAHAAATHGPWIYNGSRVLQGTFIAQQIGSIVSTMTDADALLNNPRTGHENDKIWEIKSEGLPPLNWPIQVTFTLQ